MKKFIKQLIIFLLPIIILSLPLDILISHFFSKRHSTSFVGDEFSVWNDIYEKKINSDIAIYGSSRAWVHFNSKLIADSLGHDAYNFGVDGHNFWIQHLRHKEYLKHNTPPKVIIVSVGNGTLRKRENLFNYQQFLPYMLWNNEIMKYTSSYNGFQPLDYKIPLLRYAGQINFFRQGILLALQDAENIQKRKKGFAGMDLEWNSDLSNVKKRNINKVLIHQPSIELFDSFIKECINNDITVLMVHAPVYYKGLELIDNYTEMVDIFKSFALKYKLDFLDYSKHEICYDKSNFYNANHLNKKGADLFTKQLIEDIKNTKAQKRLKRQ